MPARRGMACSCPRSSSWPRGRTTSLSLRLAASAPQARRSGGQTSAVLGTTTCQGTVATASLGADSGTIREKRWCVPCKMHGDTTCATTRSPSTSARFQDCSRNSVGCAGTELRGVELACSSPRTSARFDTRKMDEHCASATAQYNKCCRQCVFSAASLSRDGRSLVVLLCWPPAAMFSKSGKPTPSRVIGLACSLRSPSPKHGFPLKQAPALIINSGPEFPLTAHGECS